MPYKIVLKHSRIEINNYDMGDCPNLEYTFSIWDPGRHCSYYKGIEYDEANKKLIIPRGVDIPYLERLFGYEPYVDRNCDPYVDGEPIPIKYLARDERQVEIIKFIIGDGKYKYTASKSQLSINATTGAGKTFTTVASICITGARAMIITSSINWLKQWKDKILEYTPLSDKDIYNINGSTSIDRILCRDPIQYKIFLISHSTIRSYGDSHGWDAVENLFKYLRCSMKVFDEAHLYFDNMAKIDFHSNTRKTLYLTATPERSSKEENIIYQLYFKNIPSISLFDENNDPHVNYIALHFNSHPNPFIIKNLTTNYGFDRNGYANYVVQNDYFKRLVIVLIEMVLNINGKVLIYIGTNEAIKIVYDTIVLAFPFLENYIGIYTSMIDKQSKQQNLYKKIILSTTKSCGAASDIADLACTINLAEPFKSSVLAKQTLGRCRAMDTLYIDVVDNGFFFTKKYYEAKKPIFSQFAKSCKDVVMTEEEIESRADAISQKYQTKKVMCMRVFDH